MQGADLMVNDLKIFNVRGCFYLFNYFSFVKKRKTRSLLRRSLLRPQSKKKAAGAPPGQVVYIGDDRSGAVKISVIDYDDIHLEENISYSAEDCFKYKNTLTNTWINVDGIHKTDIIEKIGKNFGISSLVLEDVVNTNSRPKIDDFKDYVFIILKMLTYDREKRNLSIEHVGLILGKNFVISFQENEGDLFDTIRARLRDQQSRTRHLGSDYLIYCLMDRIVDEYFLIIEAMGEELQEMEEEVSEKTSEDFIHRFNDLKRSSIYLRKSVWPLREVISYMLRDEVSLLGTGVLPYIRDLYDHTVQVIDVTETYRDLFSDIMDLYLSTLSLKMNEVMKVLTIISTIFIPLTFIVGVYGMNFEVMPELNWKYGYLTVWMIILFVAGGLIIYFKRKRWF
jgi:magnesium transporter